MKNSWKTGTQKSEDEYKHYKQSFRKSAERLDFSNLINNYRNDIKSTWSIIKLAIAEETFCQQKFPGKINLGKKFMTKTKSVNENVNKFVTKMVQN